MAKITYVEFDGKEHVLDVAPGFSVMEGAIRSNAQGIIAECGGACSCATCHVYVDAAWFHKWDRKSESEEALLEAACDPQPNSRLSCQVKVTEELNGMLVARAGEAGVTC
jgi:2Fe-2S ferredoxin